MIPVFLVIHGPFGTTEMIVFAVIVLLLFGIKKLPTFASDMKKSWEDFWRHLP